MKNLLKDFIVILILIIASLVALIEGTIAVISFGIIKTHLCTKIGKWSERFY